MRRVNTPCIGICSTTSLGDRICRGCKRFAFEVIDWNAYSEDEKAAVMDRINLLTSQIMSRYFRIIDVDRLEQVMRDYRFFYDEALSPYLWLHNLLQKYFYRVDNLAEWGVEVSPSCQDMDIRDLISEINSELVTLSEAHFERYFQRA